MTEESPFDTPPAAPQLPPMFHNATHLPALFEALSIAQAEYTPLVRDRLVVQRLKDKQTGAYTGREIKFMYADLAAILTATRTALSKQGLAFIQPIETADDGTTWVVSVLAHKNGGMITSRMMVAPAKDQKEFGGNVTYARRFSAAPILSVSAEDDAEEDGDGVDRDNGREEELQFAPQRATPVRRSATAAPAKTTATKPSIDGHINAGQVKFLQGKLRALKLTDADAQALFERLGIDGFTEAMDLSTFAKAQTEMDRMRDA